MSKEDSIPLYYERWSQDIENDRLWNRVTDVNSARTNMYVARPEEMGQGWLCSGFRNQCQLDPCNLRPESVDSQLRRLHIGTSKDLTVINGYPTGSPKLIGGRRNPTLDRVWKDSIAPDYRKCFERTTFGQPTSERFNTLDQRFAFLPPRTPYCDEPDN